ncbi:type II toxin-antitoxin system RelE/ParE family toxin [Pseudothauera nasutitermitis]|uniref:type II toxin-antitoxin system RelE/ParE family toxin n=1 Tax=Pseudothauera nasutitermitis TaxID=2565930 RepID=UPI001B3B2B3B|nr:type II toxin-antitoxin system RelE/ParE family toxin [Pseudothauera nasutitermitis]
MVFTESAEQDLQDLRRYLLKRFDRQTWQKSYRKIREAVGTIQAFPQSGSQPDELLDLNLARYRQVVVGMNRIIYEISSENLYSISCATPGAI